MKKVKGSNFEGSKTGRINKVFGTDKRPRPAAGYADSDGLETVENWQCHEDCPIGMFPDVKVGAMGSPSTGGGCKFGGVFGSGQKTDRPHLPASSGSAARFFYCAKASKRDRNEGLEGFEEKQTWASQEKRESNSFDVFESDGRPKTLNKNNHPTVKPCDLMKYLCRLITPPGGKVLDPFMGSGTTGKACMLEGFRFIGIEIDYEYFKIARQRIKHAYTEERK